MELLLWRHAEAVEATAGQNDNSRRLTARGEKQARGVAGWLCAHYQKPLSILVSPAVRCQQTAHALELPFEIDPRIGTSADVSDLLAAAAWPAGSTAQGSAVLLIGHQPTLGRLASLLLSGQEADWSFKKGALWWFSNRTRENETQTVLRAVVSPDMV